MKKNKSFFAGWENVMNPIDLVKPVPPTCETCLFWSRGRVTIDTRLRGVHDAFGGCNSDIFKRRLSIPRNWDDIESTQAIIESDEGWSIIPGKDFYCPGYTRRKQQ